jgi:ATP-binding cassette subfamily A (ABC1) protein 1
LGRNGAGKTTTMSVLTGLFPPTSGVVRVLGKELQTEIDSIRKELGFCPQHNVLFNKLTVEEHLFFFLAMKLPLAKRFEINEKISRWLSDLSLTSKRNTLVSSLSGGMKRKLSVALAFVGSSKLVVLDEPTAGIDPYARRAIWDLLAKHKEQRTIVLSTHYMDEADILGDRVAIISDGKLCFVSTPLAFKCRFSTGYQLTLVKQQRNLVVETQLDRDIDKIDELDQNCSCDSVGNNLGSHIRHANVSPANMTSLCCHGYSQSSPRVSCFDIHAVTEFVQLYVSNARLIEDNDAEACYVIPTSMSRNGHFSSLLKELDSRKDRLGVASYGISDSSFDQAFLSATADVTKDESDPEQFDEKACSWPDWFYLNCCQRGRNQSDISIPLAENIQHSENQADDEDDRQALLPANEDANGETVDSRQQLMNGFALHCQCFKALFIKRFLHTKRDGTGFICQVLLPVIFICMALLVEHFKPQPTDSQIELSPTVYPDVNYFPLLNFQKNISNAAKLQQVVEQPCGVSAHYLVEQLDQSQCTRYMSGLINNSINNPVISPYYDWSPHSNCSCSKGRQICPSGIAFPFPPSLHTIDDVTIQDLGHTKNVTDYLMKTVDAYELHRYGGLTVGNENTQYETVETEGYHKQWIEMLGVRKSAKAWFNNRGYHSSPIYINVMNNAILRANLDRSDVSQFGITTYSDPFNWTASQILIEKMQSGYDFAFAIFVMIALSFIPPTFIMFLIQERANGAKHQQKLSGLHPLVYWTANLTWDLISYLLVVICLGSIFLAFQDPVFTSMQSFLAVLVLFVSYGWAMTPLLYLTTFIFQDSSLAYVSMLSLSVLSGLLTTITSAIMQFLQQYDDSYDGISSQLHQVFLVFPPYCLGQGLVDIAYDYYTVEINKQYGDLGVDVQSVKPFSQDEHAIGTSIAVMLAEGTACILIVLLVEYQFFTEYWLKSCKKVVKNNVMIEEDEDVSTERSKVMNCDSKDAVVQLIQLTKVYNSQLRAVDNVCLSVSKGECFGLLGVNGAGKTTIFRMLTGSLPVTQGDALILGHSVVKNVRDVRRQVGYCPQFDAINKLLTGKEHLVLYARLRGLDDGEIQQNVLWCLCKLGLSQYGDVLAGNYSGGNKRKLSTAIALIGRPQLILLDEPTTGMDPNARRFLWQVIRSLTQNGHSIILTSHSMEECEAVCTRMGILVNGRFVCLGSSQHLKARYGHGYTITLRVKGNTDNHQIIEDFFNDAFPSSKLKVKTFT